MKRKLENDASTSGLSRQGYLERLIEMGGATIFPAEFRKLFIHHIAKIGNNINQIAHRANEGEAVTAQHIKALLAMQAELERLVRSIGSYENSSEESPAKKAD